jgi:hypothetical protein
VEDEYKVSHYSQYYNGIKIDPYLVSKVWKLGEKDNSGVLFHCLKTIARFGDKNTKERELNALYNQIKRLAELEGVELVDKISERSK